MSQYGAEGFALHGWSHRQILRHYYPGTTIGHVPDRLVRVLVVEGHSRVAVTSRRPFRIVDASNRSWTLAARRLVLTPGPHVRVHGRRVALHLPLTVTPGAGVLTVDRKPYRGSLTVFRAGRALSVVNTLRLELYVRGVIGWEMPHRWQPEALAAQAVAARSYALSVLHPTQAFDLYSDTRDQEYGGIRAEYPSTDAAVAETAGEAVLWRGSVARTYYSSTSGGRTQALADALPGLSPVPYLVSVSDPYDSLSPRHRWGPLRFSPARVARLLDVPRPTSLRVRRNDSGRVASVDVIWRGGDATVGGRDFQRHLDLPSTWFSVSAPGHAHARVTHAGGAKAKRANVPKRLAGWFVIVRSAPVTGPAGELRAVARAAHGRVLRSSLHPPLRSGFWVVAVGPYASRASAGAAVRTLTGRFPGAYRRHLR
jgi:stage II sporulation protein D